MLTKEIKDGINTELLTVKETAKLARMCPASVYLHLKEGNFKSYVLKSKRSNLRGKRLISRASVEEFLAKCLIVRN